ncbi:MULTISPECIES: TolC family protein [Winogradskyella]|jgi:outer membrane protein|uniref:TolC family protein n=1 Tax=Winogradskyella TaxID=286104 RepID=UPI001FB27E0D|nr:TolC family protein [Winogradskyella sp. MH6]
MKKSIIVILLLFVALGQAQDKKWTLLECVNYALENNISIKQSELDLELANIAKKDAIGNFLPSLNASASQNWNIGLSQDPVTFNAVNSTAKNLSGGLRSSVDIFRGLQNINTLRRAKINQLASQYQLDKMRDDTSMFVANAFLQILANREQLKVVQGQNKVTKENIKNTQELVDAGVLPQGDLLEIKATDATQLQQIINAENALFLSKLSLAQLLQIKDYTSFDIVDVDYGLVSEDVLTKSAQEIFEKAKEELNDVKLVKTNAEIAEFDVKISRGALLPSLTGSYSFSSNYFTSDLFDTPDFETQITDNKSHNFSLSLNIPIFNGFSTKNNVNRNKVNLERAKFQLEQTELDLESTVYQAYNDAKNSKKSYEAALKTEEARRLAFEYAKERYDVGLSNSFDFNQSRTAYENAQSDVVRTKYDYIFRLKILEFYFGLPITDLN